MQLFIGFIPLLLAATLTLILIFHPSMYEQYLFVRDWRERQLIEVLTFLVALVAGGILLVQGIRCTRSSRPGVNPGAKLPGLTKRMGGVVILIFALASLFLAGEEINWGQTFYRWDIPQHVMMMEYGAVSLHNQGQLPIRIQGLGLFFLLNGFLTFPLLWRFRDRFNFPLSLKPAVPEAASIIAVVSSAFWERSLFAADFVKNLLGSLTGLPFFDGPLYDAVLNQMDEQRELMIAIAILIYSVYRIRSVAVHLSSYGTGDSGRTIRD